MARQVPAAPLLPRRDRAVLHAGRAQDPAGPVRDLHHAHLPVVQEPAREPVPVVRVSRPRVAVLGVLSAARGPADVAPRLRPVLRRRRLRLPAVQRARAQRHVLQDALPQNKPEGHRRGVSVLLVARRHSAEQVRAHLVGLLPARAVQAQGALRAGAEGRARLGGQAGGEDAGGIAQGRRQKRRERASGGRFRRDCGKERARRRRSGTGDVGERVGERRLRGRLGVAPPREGSGGGGAGRRQGWRGGVARLGSGFQLAVVDLRRATKPAGAATAQRRRGRAARFARFRDARDGDW